MRNIKLVIFDLDGTAADTMDGIVEALNRTMTECGYPTHTRESVLQFVNYNTRRYIEEALPPDARTDEVIDRLLARYTHHYEDTYTLTFPFEGIPDLLKRLSETCLVAINSNKQDAFVKALADKLFSDIPLIAAEGYRPDRPFKPDPTMAFAIMDMASEKLGVTLTPDECVYVGDSDVDVLTAKNAQVPCLSVTWGFRDVPELEAAGAKYFCHDTAKLQESLDAIVSEIYGQ